ncbi:3-deoxy-8-phosphooctulonate synthase [Halodesulfovibrio marinisediminis]|uniref:2-dehydro-3-deoxyphosphooctonate aldolase n=1 Tax=Halodesulfovibrio marinisediminis DSM 17456 TaxID=1121457 RepID=A0A1N6E787_9BACT|nr:3-deoxy-8-phosphooctulonate synthase [Halodesulfovibrio marinisediminis]SIN78898.1 2-dehydro-3-deoxyphosphooctonate aldolase (KDO 8-P synthase) [Halodesulfovibrio marinisediminis DSM 17456]
MKHIENGSALYAELTTKPFIFAGPCALESFELALETAHAVKEAADAVGLKAIFKSSYDKANRTSLSSFRGPGLTKGIEWLARIKEETGLPVVTDIHEPDQAEPVAEVADVMQIPAFLCRQTSLLLAAANTGRVINVKKGQFVAPWDMKPALDKLFSTGNKNILLTERGASFGYNNLVVDFRSFLIMQSFGVPVVFDATHSVQLPGGQGGSSGGDRSFVPRLSRAAVAAGVNGVFIETHPDPDNALCDGPNSWPLAKLPHLLRDLTALWSMNYES